MVSGPSGVGKGAIVERLLGLIGDVQLSISATTRPARPDEAEGVHYYFLEPAAFQAVIDRGGFLEWADVFGRRYGTPRAPVEQALAAGRDVLLEVNVDGARQVRAGTDEAHLVFIKPPTLAELERRLRQRGTECEEQVRRRLVAATEELRTEPEFDETVVNDDLDAAVKAVADAIARQRARDR